MPEADRRARQAAKEKAEKAAQAKAKKAEERAKAQVVKEEKAQEKAQKAAIDAAAEKERNVSVPRDQKETTHWSQEEHFDPFVGDREEEAAELLEKIDRVPGFAIAFLMDEGHDFWDDDYVDSAKAQLWEYVTKQLIQEIRKKMMEKDDAGDGAAMSLIGGMVGGGGGKNLNTAEVHLMKGKEHMERKEYALAVECFKSASNWYFKAGDRRFSDLAKAEARRAKAALTQEELEITFANTATKRMATARDKWEKKRDGELSFGRGDCIRVIEAAEDEMKEEYSIKQPYTWYRGELDGEVGLFPTRQLLYRPSGKPVLDQANRHSHRMVVVLDASPLYIRYSKGDSMEDGDDVESGFGSADMEKLLKPQLEQVCRPITAVSGLSTRPNTEYYKSKTAPSTRAPTSKSLFDDDAKTAANSKNEEEEDGEKTSQMSTAGRLMDLDEFIQMLTDLQLVCPAGYTPTSFQISRDQALTIFRMANRGEVSDDDSSQLDFEEFLKAMEAVKMLLRIPDSTDEIETVKEGYWACSYGIRTFQRALENINTVTKLISSVDESWATLLKHKTEELALSYGAFEEAHARQLTMDMRYDWAYQHYEHATTLYSGQTGHEMTEFQPNEQRKITLNRAFVVNQYKAANQLMRLVAPNASSHRGIPAHLGDPRKPLEIVSRAVAIYEELADNSGVATILAAGAEVALRLGNLQEALRQAEGCQNEYSRLADQQGLASSYRLLGNIQLVDGKLFAAVGSVQSSLQIAADENDVANELASHEMLGRIQLSLDNIDRSDGHFASCQRLGKTAHQIEILGRATAGRGYVAMVRGRFDSALEYLRAALGMLRLCDERQEASRVIFEIARIQRYRTEEGWQRRMEEATTLLTRTIPTFTSQKNELFIARAQAQAWIWRTVARLNSELRARMLQGETLIDTMQQLAWEALEEGKSVLAEVEKVGDRMTRAEVLFNTVEMQMLGLREASSVQATIDDVKKVFDENSCQRQLARCDQLVARVKIFAHDYVNAKLLLTGANRRLVNTGCSGGIDEAEVLWFHAIALRLAGEEAEGRDMLARVIVLYERLRSSRLCSLCSVQIRGACYTCLACYQRDYCKDCYAECALNGRSCHPSASMIRAARPM